MGKLALMAIASFTVMASYYGLNAQRGMLGAGSSVSQHQYRIVARNAALTGFERAKQLLAEDYDGSTSVTFDGTYEHADYTVMIMTDPSNSQWRDVKVTSHLKLKGAENQKYEITAKLGEVLSLAEDPPPFLQYAVLSEYAMTLEDDFETEVTTDADGNLSAENANVHTNEQVVVKPGAYVRGFVTYSKSGGVSIDPAATIAPLNNPTYEPVTQQVPKVTIPTFTAAQLRDSLLADGYNIDLTTSSSLTLTGTIAGGTRTDPFVYYISSGQSLTIQDATFTGYTIFLVEDDVLLTGDVNAGLTGYDGSESAVAIYANDDITVVASAGDDMAFNAQFFCIDDFILEGNIEVYGSVTARGTVTMKPKDGYSPVVHYRPASPALTTMWQDNQDRLKLLAYSER